jgi:hypothetical protein
VHDAIGSERQERVDVAGPGDPEAAAESGQLAGVPADLVGVGDEESDQLEFRVGIDAGQGVAADVARAPLHDAVWHGEAP